MSTPPPAPLPPPQGWDAPQPGAAPTMPPALVPPMPPPQSRASPIAITALVLAIVGIVFALLPFVTFAAGLLLIPAIVLAIVALAKGPRGRGLAIGALVTSGAAVLVSAGMIVVTIALTGTIARDVQARLADPQPQASPSAAADGPRSYDVYVTLPSDAGTTLSDPLSPGTTLTAKAIGSGRDALRVSVGAAIDVSSAARTGGAAAPENGAYVAVPVTISVLDGDALTDEESENIVIPASEWVSSSGEEIGPVDISVPGYPGLQDVDLPTARPVTFYDVFDVRPTNLTHGVYGFRLFLDADGQGSDAVFWGREG